MPTFGCIDCPNCIEHYLVPDWPLSNPLPKNARVYLACPGCNQTLEALAVEIEIIYKCESGFAQHARFLEIKPPDATAQRTTRNHALRCVIVRKNRLRAELGQGWERYLSSNTITISTS